MSRYTEDFPHGWPMVRPLIGEERRAIERAYGDFDALKFYYDGITAALRSAVPGDPKGWVDKVATLVESRDRFRGEAQAAQKMRECEGPEPCGECLKCLSAELRVVKQERDQARAGNAALNDHAASLSKQLEAVNHTLDQHKVPVDPSKPGAVARIEALVKQRDDFLSETYPGGFLDIKRQIEQLTAERDEARALLAVANRGTPPAEPAAVTAPAVDPGEGYVLLDAKDVILATDEYSHGHEIPGRARAWHPISPNSVVRTRGGRTVESMQDEYDEPTYYRRRVDRDTKPQNVSMQEDDRVVSAVRRSIVETHRMMRGHERADRAEQKVLVLERLLDAITEHGTGSEERMSDEKAVDLDAIEATKQDPTIKGERIRAWEDDVVRLETLLRVLSEAQSRSRLRGTGMVEWLADQVHIVETRLREVDRG